MKYVYLLCTEVDLGYHVEAVYASLESIHYKLVPSKYYDGYDPVTRTFKNEHISEDTWDVEGRHDSLGKAWVERREVE